MANALPYCAGSVRRWRRVNNETSNGPLASPTTAAAATTTQSHRRPAPGIGVARLVADPVLDVRYGGRVDHLDRLERGVADVLEQTLSRAQDDWHDMQVELVEEPSLEVLPDRVRTAGDHDVACSSRRARE